MAFISTLSVMNYESGRTVIILVGRKRFYELRYQAYFSTLVRFAIKSLGLYNYIFSKLVEGVILYFSNLFFAKIALWVLAHLIFFFFFFFFFSEILINNNLWLTFQSLPLFTLITLKSFCYGFIFEKFIKFAWYAFCFTDFFK